MYHVADRPDGVHWDGMEYYSSQLRRGVLYAFRGSGKDLPTHRFRLAGLNRASRYRLTFHDNPAANREVTGDALMQMGVDVALPLPLSSDLIFFEEVR